MADNMVIFRAVKIEIEVWTTSSKFNDVVILGSILNLQALGVVSSLCIYDIFLRCFKTT